MLLVFIVTINTLIIVTKKERLNTLTSEIPLKWQKVKGQEVFRK